MAASGKKIWRGWVGVATFLALAGLGGVPAYGDTDFTALFDLDHDTATGCTVATADGPFLGVEQRLITTVATSNPLTVVSVVRQICSAGPPANTWGPAIPVASPFTPPWPVGVANGSNGFDVVETYLPLTGIPHGIYRLGFTSALVGGGAGDDALTTTNGGPTGAPILLPNQSVVEVPTLGSWALLGLALLLLVSGLALLRQRRTRASGLLAVLLLTAGLGVAYATFTPDGDPTGWTAAQLLATDALPASPVNLDIGAVFGIVLGDQLLLRIDADLAVDDAPSVAATTPADGASNVGGNSDLTVAFSEPVNVTGNWFQIVCATSGTRNVADTVVTGGPTTFTINPNVDFAGGESCTLTVVAAQVADQDSIDPPDTMAANATATFVMDVAPSVLSTAPANGATQVGTQSDLTVTFSEPVNVTGNWFQLVCGTSGTRNVVDTVVSGGPTAFTINPNADFATGESCTLTVFAAQVADQDTNDPPDLMVANATATFATDVAPGVASTVPANGATNQAANVNLAVNFSEPVTVAGNWFQIVCGTSGIRNVADTVVTGGPTAFAINPNADFAAGESCTLTIFAAQVADLDTGDPPDTMTGDVTATFAIDAAPAVTATTPINGGFAALGDDLTVTFSEPVNVSGNWFQIACATSGTRAVGDTVVTGGPTTFTINPNTDFAGGESCTATIFAAQVADQDAADPPDNPAADYVFTFSADAAPAVSSTTPTNGAIDQAGNTNLTVTFSEPVNVAGNWFQIVCPTSGTRNVVDTVVTGGPTTFTVNPNADFAGGETCTTTVFAAQVTDQDSNDPPDNMAANDVFSFAIDAAPSVSTTTPANGAIDLATTTNLTVTFSEPVNVTGNWFQILCGTSGTRNVVDTVVTGGPTTFTINPNVDFAANESCTTTVFAAQVTDVDTNDPPDTMAANYAFTFGTDAAPFVQSSAPANGATTATTTGNLTITFSENVNLTGNWFQIACVTSGTRNVSDTAVTGGPGVYTINPNADFAAGESCTTTVFAAQVSDVDANDPPDQMVADHVFTFTVDAAPVVTATTPTNGGFASLSDDLTVTFSEPVNVSGNWFQILCPTSGNRNVADTVVTGGPTTFTINPNADFAGGETCTATIFAAQVSDQDAADPPDNPAANYVFSFTADAPPAVSSTTPTNGATDQAGNANLTVTFSEPVNVVGNWFQIVCPTSGTRNVADTVVTGGPTIFTINPNSDFAGGETCTATVFAAQVTDVDTNDPPDNMAANYVFSYTIDVAPSVAATTPANGATGLTTTTDLTVTFSEPVNVIGNWFQIVCTTSGTRNVADTAVSGGPTIYTINPNFDLAAGDSCTTTVFAAQVTDVDANDPPDNMAANYLFTFAVDAAPAVFSTAPANGATTATTTGDLTITFTEPVNVGSGWFQIACATSGIRNVADTVVTGGPTVFSINPNVDFAAGESCTTTVFAAAVTDVDANDPPDNMAANYVFTYSIDAAPSVTATTPTNGGVATAAANLTITFSEPVNVAGNWFQIACGTSGTRNVADTVVTGGPTTFTVNPNVDFTAPESCTTTVFATQVTDVDANDPPDNMAADHVFTFSIDAAPSVTATIPVDTATVQATNTDLTITFSEPVNVAGNWLQILCSSSGTRNVADTVVSGGPTTFTVNPNADFAAGETCTTTVFAAQVTDVDTNDPPDNMAANYVFAFTTDLPPSVTAETPTSGATDQTSNTNLTVTFSEPVNVAGNWFQILCGTSGTRNVADTAVSGGPTTFTINPNVDFAAGESCTTTVFAAQVTDQDTGDPPDNMAANHSWTFTVDAAPSVSSTIPADLATQQPTNTNLTITFSEPVNVAGNWFQIVCNPGAVTRNVADTVVSGGPTTFAIDPNVDFGGGQTCTTTVFATQVTDVDANDPPDNMAANHVFSFTTDAPPSVSSTSPTNGTTDVPNTSAITVNFSEPVNVTASAFTLECPVGTPKAFTLAPVPPGAASSFTLAPTASLPGNVTCTVTAIATQITDVDANDPPDNMLADFPFSFTIANTPPTAVANGYDFIGNTQLQVSNLDSVAGPHVFVNGNVLANDTDPDGPSPLAVDRIVGCGDLTPPFDCPTTNGGAVSMDTAGHFIYTAKEGDTNATDSFQYRVTDSLATADATVTLTRFQRVWYVMNNATAGGLGRSNDPFDTLAEAQTASLAGDWIFVYFGDGTTTGQAAGIVLKGSQHLIGEHAGLTIPITGTFNGATNPNISLVAAAPGNRPLLDNPAAGGNAVSAPDVIPTEIVALNLAGTTNGIDWTTTGAFAGSGTLTISDNVVRSAGVEGIDINLAGSGATTLSFHDNTLTATGNGLDILETGTGALTITNFANNVVSGNTGGIGININTAIFDATPGNPITTVSGGTTAIGASGNGVGTTGMQLSNVTGDLSFTDLDIFNDSGTGLGVTSTGALNAGTGAGFKIAVGAGVATIDSTGGPAVSINNASANLPLSFLRSTNSTTTGLSLLNAFGGVGGTALSVSSGQITDPVGASGTAVNINGGTGNITLGIPITNNSGNAIVVTGRTGDTVAFSGAITETGTGISLTSNGGATIAFTGAISATTGANPAFTATGGGTVTSTDTTSTLTTTTGTALNVASTTIGAAGLKFRSITANGGANGIVLDTTGATGSLTVSGTGGAGTGGTIRNMVGGDGASAGNGIYLNATTNPSFSWMQLNDFQNFAIRGIGVAGLTLNNTIINGTNGNNATAPFNEGSASFTNLTGSVAVSSTNISGGLADNFRVVNSSGSLNRITFSSVTIGANSTANGNDGITLESTGASTVINATIQNSFFTSARGDLFQLNVIGNSTDDLVFTGNTLSNNHPGIATGGGGVTISGGDNTGTGANLTFNIANNSFRDADGHAILIVKSTDPGTFNGTFANNTIGVAAVADSGSKSGSGLKLQSAGLGTVTASITNNQIYQYNNFGIELLTGGGATALAGALNTTITGNTISNPGTGGLPMNGIQLNGGTVPGDTYQICTKIGGAGALSNSITGSGANGGTDFRLRQRQNTTVRLPGYAGANNDNTAVVTFGQGNNGGASGLASNTVGSGGGGFVGGGSTCP